MQRKRSARATEAQAVVGYSGALANHLGRCRSQFLADPDHADAVPFTGFACNAGFAALTRLAPGRLSRCWRRSGTVRAVTTRPTSTCFAGRPSLVWRSSNHAAAHAIATANSTSSINAIALAASSVMGCHSS